MRALTLDFGGTLALERRGRAQLYVDAAEALGLAIPTTEMQALMRVTYKALGPEVEGAFRGTDPWFRAFIARIFCGELGLDRAHLAALEERLFGAFRDPATFELRPGAHELCAAARAQGLALGVVSNWTPHLPGILAGLGLEFDTIVLSSVERIEKPDQRLYILALERLGLAPTAAHLALHVGDHPVRDAEAALAAGMQAALVDPDGTMTPPAGARCVPDLAALAAELLPTSP